MKFSDWGEVRSSSDLISILRSVGVEVDRTGCVPAVSVMALMDRAAFVLDLLREANEGRQRVRSGVLTAIEEAETLGEIDALEDYLIGFSQTEFSGKSKKSNILQFPVRIKP